MIFTISIDGLRARTDAQVEERIRSSELKVACCGVESGTAKGY
jgi:hypothetical protein